jgi:hypothetical protein
MQPSQVGHWNVRNVAYSGRTCTVGHAALSDSTWECSSWQPSFQVGHGNVKNRALSGRAWECKECSLVR